MSLLWQGAIKQQSTLVVQNFHFGKCNVSVVILQVNASASITNNVMANQTTESAVHVFSNPSSGFIQNNIVMKC